MRRMAGNSGWGGLEVRVAWCFGEKKEGQSGCHLAMPWGVRTCRWAGPGGWSWGVCHLFYAQWEATEVFNKHLKMKA